MKEYTMFNYDFLFQDHFAVSDKAKLLYIEMNFFALNGFVTNPLAICDSRGYGKDALIELIASGDVLVLDGRSEVFLTSFFLHNKGAKRTSWLSTPFGQYWYKKLYIKKNGIATFTPQPDNPDDPEAEPLPYDPKEAAEIIKTKWNE